MAVPKKRQTRGRTKRRRAGHRKPSKLSLIKCPKCHEFTHPHKMCINCGYYNGKQIVDVTARLKKKEKKMKEKELKEAENNKPLDARDLSKKS